LPNEFFQSVVKVIEYLGSSSDIFRPQIEEQLQDANVNIDIETERWIIDLLANDAGGSTPKEGVVRGQGDEEHTVAVPRVELQTDQVGSIITRSLLSIITRSLLSIVTRLAFATKHLLTHSSFLPSLSAPTLPGACV
jgi:hypothetical protein